MMRDVLAVVFAIVVYVLLRSVMKRMGVPV